MATAANEPRLTQMVPAMVHVQEVVMDCADPSGPALFWARPAAADAWRNRPALPTGRVCHEPVEQVGLLLGGIVVDPQAVVAPVGDDLQLGTGDDRGCSFGMPEGQAIGAADTRPETARPRVPSGEPVGARPEGSAPG